MSEPVALRYEFDGNGYLYMDAGSGSDWASRVKDCEFLYTHPMRELTDEEIINFEWAIKNIFNFSQSEKVVGLDRVIKAILKKASEK